LDIEDDIMKIQHKNYRSGMTLIELLITVTAAMILILGISGILAAGHRQYNTMFKRINSEVVRNGYEARSIFDRIVRKASFRDCVLSNERDDWEGTYDKLTVYYYSDPNDPNIIEPDRYATFSKGPADPNLILEEGDIQPGTFSTGPVLINPGPSIVIAKNVSEASDVPGIFSEYGNHGIKMTLTLDDENIPGNTDKLTTLKMTITSTMIRHNR